MHDDLRMVPSRKKLAPRAHNRATYGIQDVPEFLRDNEYITTGFRPPMTRLWDVVCTLWTVHNETSNIWSHLIAAAAAALGAKMFAPRTYAAPGLIYMVSVAALFTVSWWAHLTWPLGERYSRIAFKLDYLGIVVVIFTHSFPVAFYLYMCTSTLVKLAYIGSVASLGACLSWLTLSDRFGQPSWRAVRSVCYSAYSVVTFAPVAYAAYVYKNEPSTLPQLGIACTCIDLCMNGISALVFAQRWPEKRHPKRFDIVGNSHNIMHVCSTVALLSMFGSIYAWWVWRAESNFLCLPLISHILIP